MDYGITRIYSPDDGRAMGLQGMINDLVEKSDFPIGDKLANEVDELATKNPLAIARLISAAENFYDSNKATFIKSKRTVRKSLLHRFLVSQEQEVQENLRWWMKSCEDFSLILKTRTVALISVDPSKRKTGGALLGDRIRMNAINNPRVYMRSLATRQSNLALSAYVKEAIQILKAANYDLIILETSGIGQSDTEILDHSDVSLYVMTPEYGAATQLEKIDMLDFADVIALTNLTSVVRWMLYAM